MSDNGRCDPLSNNAFECTARQHDSRRHQPQIQSHKRKLDRRTALPDPRTSTSTNLTELLRRAQDAFANSISASSRGAYSTGQRAYSKFRTARGIPGSERCRLLGIRGRSSALRNSYLYHTSSNKAVERRTIPNSKSARTMWVVCSKAFAARALHGGCSSGTHNHTRSPNPSDFRGGPANRVTVTLT